MIYTCILIQNVLLLHVDPDVVNTLWNYHFCQLICFTFIVLKISNLLTKKLILSGFLLQWNLSKPNFLGTRFCVRIRQVFGWYRLNLHRFSTLGLYLKFCLFRISYYSGFGLEMIHCIRHYLTFNYDVETALKRNVYCMVLFLHSRLYIYESWRNWNTYMILHQGSLNSFWKKRKFVISWIGMIFIIWISKLK